MAGSEIIETDQAAKLLALQAAGACRHPRPAPAPARRAQVRQGRALVGARGHPIADRCQRTSKHPRGQARGSSA
eukprot:scaffold1174_cov62-Phaeocystis_antarctica.AAC.2